jgi:hypothetical protein
MSIDKEIGSTSESRLVQCAGCDSLYPASKTDNDELVPDGIKSSGNCPHCGGTEFAQVILQTR